VGGDGGGCGRGSVVSAGSTWGDPVHRRPAGDGRRGDIVVGTGNGSPSTVNVFSGTTNFALWRLSMLSTFQPYGAAFKGGVRVTTKPADGGNPGSVEKVNILTAPGPGGGGLVTIVRQASFTGYDLPPLLFDKLSPDPNYSAIFVG
jgi:hypothetical protein